LAVAIRLSSASAPGRSHSSARLSSTQNADGDTQTAPGFRGRSGIRRYFGAAAAHGFRAQGAITEARVTDAGNVLASGRLL
jgi:hypothetical protein